MKKLFLSILTAVFAFSAVSQETLQVDVTKLNAEQLRVYQQLKQAQMANSFSVDQITPEKIDKYAQMGKGLGVAINEGLGAVTKNVESFSQTSAGKWLMVLITWKVMGADAIGLTRTLVQWVVGGGLLIVGVPFWIWLVYRNCIRAPIATVEKTSFWTKKVTYTSREPLHSDYILGYGACFLVYVLACVAITFIH